MFNKAPLLGFRALIFAALAIVLMVVDHRTTFLRPVRSAVATVIAPLQYTVAMPGNWFEWTEANIVSHRQLLADNADLRAKILLLQAQLQQFLALKKENDQLRELLSSSPKAGGRVVVAQILSVAADPFVREVVLDKGSRDGVYRGQPVLDAFGVFGQVVSVSPLTCNVLLLTDSRSAVPVQDNRNGLRAMVIGTGDIDELRIAHVTDSEDILPGDLLVTSGLGERYPPGYPVGTVLEVKHPSGDEFADVTVKPSAHLNRDRLVLLVWPPVQQPVNFAVGTISSKIRRRA